MLARTLLMLSMALVACDPPAPSSTSSATSAVTASPAASTGAGTTPAASASGSGRPWASSHARLAASVSASARATTKPPPEVTPRLWWAPKGHRLLLVRGRGAEVVDLRAPQAHRRLAVDGAVVTADWSDDGTALVTVSAAGMVQLWSAGGTERPSSMKLPAGVRLARLSHTARRLAVVAGDEGAVSVWDVAGKPLPPLQGDHSGIWALAFMPGEGHLVATDFATAHVWKLDTGAHVGSHTFATGGTSPITVSRDGTFAASAEQLHELKAWQVGKDEAVSLEVVSKCDAHLYGLEIGLGSQIIKTYSAAGWWRSWNLPALSPRTSWTSPGLQPDEQSWMSNDGGTVVRTTGGKGEVYNAYTGKKRVDLEGQIGGAALSFSADDRYLATAEPALTVWDTVSGKRVPVGVQ